MPRTSRRRNRRYRRSLKKKQNQRGGQLVDELAAWRADVKQARSEVGSDLPNLTFAKLAEKKIPIDDRVVINSPYYNNLTVGDAASHLRIYFGAYFDTPNSYTMENARSGLALRKAEIAAGEEDLSYVFLANVEAALSGQNTVDISNIQNYPLFAFYLVANSEGGDPLSEAARPIRPILMTEGPAAPGV